MITKGLFACLALSLESLFVLHHPFTSVKPRLVHGSQGLLRRTPSEPESSLRVCFTGVRDVPSGLGI